MRVGKRDERANNEREGLLCRYTTGYELLHNKSEETATENVRKVKYRTERKGDKLGKKEGIGMKEKMESR